MLSNDLSHEVTSSAEVATPLNEESICQMLWLSLPLREALWADLVDAIPESLVPPNSNLLIYRVRNVNWPAERRAA
jgi:hypothetical protein